MGHHTFLRELGARLRQGRLARGLAVGEAAAAAGLSRRYLTDAEAGRANPSVLVLLRLSQALGTPLAELVDLPLAPLARERIALVGLRGAGKSTVGRAVAQALEVPFVELDRRVEELAGVDLGELFDLQGPEAFHRYEREALEQVLSEGERLVLAAGGSIVADEANFDRLRASCRTVWLRARPADHFERVVAQGDARPMRDRPRAMEELEAILEEREPLYARCRHVVDTAGKEAGAVVAEVLHFCEHASGS